MIKRIINILLVMSFALCGITVPVDAAEQNIHIYFNDSEIVFKNKPTLSGDTIMCELEPVFDALGIEYNYNGIKNTISCFKDKKYTLNAVMGESTCEADLCIVELDAPFERKGNKTIMPLDSVCYIYNILIDRSNLSKVVLSKKPPKPVYDYNAAVAEAVAAAPGAWGIFEEGEDFFKVAVHENETNGTVWWTEEEVPIDDPNVGVDTATRINVINLPATAYSYQIKYSPDKEIPEDSLVLITFWAKSIYAANDTTTARANVVWEQIGNGWPKTINDTFLLSNKWEKYHFYSPIVKTNPANGFQLGFRFCHNLQTFDIADFQMTVIPNGAKMELPARPADYQGSEDDAIWRKEALKRIEKYRMNNLTVNVVDQDGNPVKDAKVELDMTRSEMNWGSLAWGTTIVPRFDTYNKQSDETNELWEQLLANGINTIVLGNENKPKNYNQRFIENFISYCIENDLEYRAHAYGWDTVAEDLVLPRWKEDPIVRGYHHESEMRNRHLEQINLMATYAQSTNKVPIEIDVHNEVSNYYDRTLDPEYATGLDQLVQYFKLADAINPDSVLVLNEAAFGGMAPGDGVTDLFPDLCKALVEMGCPFDALGMQGHVAQANYPYYWYENAERISPYTDYITVTEFDTTEKRPDYLYKYVRDTLIACYSHPKIKTFTIWTPSWVGNSSNRLEVLFTKGTEGRYYDPLPGWDAWQELVSGEWWTDMESLTDDNGEAVFRAHRGRHNVKVTVNGVSNELLITLTDVDENNKATAVVANGEITLSSPVEYIKGEPKKYIEASDFGKKTEFYELPNIEYSIEKKGNILGCVDSNGKDASIVVDMDDATVWMAFDESDGVTVELDKVHDLKQIEISWGDGFVKRFNHKIEVSEDGENWTLVKTGLNGSQIQFTGLNNHKGKYVRVSGVGTQLVIKDLHVFVN